MKAAAVVMLLWSAQSSAPLLYSGIADDRSNEVKHGLYDIREAARAFLVQQNSNNKTHWQAMDPNLKVLVSRCAVPLTAAWVPRSYGLSHLSVWVICTKTVNKDEKAWKVPVPVAAVGGTGN
ncbi:hypothetical protein [Dyella silvatica]|uniref:hypothetical protein n=1 Tax=Dyella silvatica TaxID=2992128 RepID=UPI00225A913F|nr:hypothetical protein [Dyella silvatica]